MHLMKLAAVIPLLFALAGCDDNDSGSTITPPPPPDKIDDGNPGDGNVQGSICYSSGLCLPSAYVYQIPDSTKQYVYPDPRDFPNAAWRDQYARPQHVISLRGVDVNKAIAANFQLKDFIRYQGGAKTFDYAVLMRTLVNKVQAVRNALNKPILITSAYRTPGYNKTLNGAAKFSRHVYGDGVDIVSSHASAGTLKRLCDQQGAYYSYAYADGHAHCDWRHLQLDTSFYPGAEPPRLATLDTKDPYFLTGGTINMEVDQTGQYFQLSLIDFMPFDDHEGEHIFDWYIVTPSGETFRSANEKVVLKGHTGTYYIQLTMGESVHFEKTITW